MFTACSRLLLLTLVCLAVALSAFAQATSTLTFTASPDHATIAQGVPVVASYELVVTPQGGQPAAPLSLAKPAPNAQNAISLNVTTYLNSLPAGTYTASVRAVGPGGSGVSPMSDPFALVVPAATAPGKPAVSRSGS